MTSRETGPTSPSARFRRYLEILPSIDGWFSPEAATIWWALAHQQEELGITGDLLEIGVWRGKSAVLGALLARQQERCTLVDAEVRRPDLEYQFARVGMRLDARVRLIETDARSMAGLDEIRAPSRFRWIHIDEEHSASAVLEDLRLAFRLLSDGGIVCVNAYMSPTHPQVTAALLDYARDPASELRMFLGGFDKAYLTTASHVRHYMTYCHHRLIEELERWGTMATLTKKTTAEALNFFGICDRAGAARVLGLDGAEHRVEY